MMVVRHRATNRPRRATERESATITGFADLFRQLEQNLPASTQRGVLRRTGKIAMQSIADRIEETAPERSGQTKASVRLTVRFLKATAHLGAAIMVSVGVGDRKVFWPRFSEHGTVKEPARPFVRPAFDNGVAGIIERLKIELALQIHKAIARRAKRLAKRGG